MSFTHSPSHSSVTLEVEEPTDMLHGLHQKHVSTEQLDVVGDLDLEARFSSPGGVVNEKEAFSSGSTPHPQVGPATLSHDDPENPKNWPTSRKVLINFTLCIWVLTLTYSSTAYVASLTALESHFNVSQEVAILGVSLIVIGFSCGPLLFGPLSDLLGRRQIYIFTGIAYTGFAFGSAFAPNIATMLVMRFLMGLAGSSSLNNVPASIVDFTTPETRGLYTILYALCAFGGPALGPLCSAFIEDRAGWRWNFRVMAIFIAVTSFAVAWVPETHGPTLLAWRLKKEGKAPPVLTVGQLIPVLKIALARPFIFIVTEPTVTFVSIYLSLLYAILYGFFEAFSLVWLRIRGFSTTSYGLTYISLGLGFLLGCILLATVGVRFYKQQAAKAAALGKKTPPEARLGLSFVAGFLAPVSLFIFAWTAPFPHIHWMVPCLAEFLFGLSMLSIFTSFIPYLTDSYQMTAGSALAAGTTCRALLGGVFPLFSIQMFEKLTVQGATSLLAGLCLLLAPLPYVFWFKGEAMRARSKYIN